MMAFYAIWAVLGATGGSAMVKAAYFSGTPAVSESCGTWGNNILCENVDYKHLINISKIALPLDVDVPSADELFKD